MRLKALLGCGANAYRLETLPELAPTLLPAAERLGANVSNDLDLDTMRAEGGTNSLVVGISGSAPWFQRSG
jgi:hypothetical protein